MPGAAAGESSPGHHHQLYSLVALQIGDIQSYVSRLYVFLACEKSSLIFLVDNGPWSEHRSRPAELWQLILTKSRVSPFANQRLRRRTLASDESSGVELTRKKRAEMINTGLRHLQLRDWDKLVNILRGFCWNLVHSRIFCPLFHGCVAFEVSWDDVRGMNYLNELQTDTCLSLEVKHMRKREFDSLQQAVEFYSGECEAASELKHHLHQPGKRERERGLFSGIDSSDRFKRQCLPEQQHQQQENTSDINFHTPEKASKPLKFISSPEEDQTRAPGETSPVTPPVTPVTPRRKLRGFKQEVPVAHTFRDALVVFRFSDPLLPFELRDIITSNQRLLKMLESGLPPWVIFLQSYPIFCKIYRPWMRPLARTIYFLISLITVMIGFYDLYKNVPVLKATAAHMLGPLFEWIESWEMVSRLKYLGTMLVLQNYEKAFVWVLMSFKAVKQLLSLMMRPVLEPLMILWSFFLPVLITIADGAQSLGVFLGSILGSFLVAAGYVFNVVAWPFYVFLATLWNLVCAVIYPVLATVRVILSLPVLVAQFVGEFWSSFSSDLIKLLAEGLIKLLAEGYTLMSKTMWLASPVDVPRSPSVWRLLWDDLFSKVFRAVRYILNGLVAFFTSLNRHRLSIYNNIVAFLVRMIDVLESGRGAVIDVWHRIKLRTAATAAEEDQQFKED